MANKVVIVSGPIGAGKSELVQALRNRFGCRLVKSHEIISRLKGVPLERESLQRAGEELDKETTGAWLGSEVARQADGLEQPWMIVIDAARLKLQVDGVRRAFGEIVTHVHLTAPNGVLRARYTSREGNIPASTAYEDIKRDPTEAQIEDLAAYADVKIDTDQNEIEDVVVRVANRLGLYGRDSQPLVDVVIGGQFGSEGKGQICAYLAPEYDLLIRVGGPNAGHKVYEESEPYTFHTLPSGTRVAERASLLLGPGAVLNIQTLLREIADCEVSYKRLAIDPNALVIEPWDIAQENGLKESIGSTGQGVGFATARKILRNKFPGAANVRLAKDVPELRHFIRPALEVLANAYRDCQRILLEGTQGTGLSLHHGEYPYVTSRDTTVSGCLSETGIPPHRTRRVVMVCRRYPIRVASPANGSSGPMGLEREWNDIAARAGIPESELQEKEKTSTTKRQRRVAEFGWRRIRDATTLNAPTDIALTFADYIDVQNRQARRFDQLTEESVVFVEELERVARAPVSLIATRFHYRAIIDRRHW